GPNSPTSRGTFSRVASLYSNVLLLTALLHFLRNRPRGRVQRDHVVGVARPLVVPQTLGPDVHGATPARLAQFDELARQLRRRQAVGLLELEERESELDAPGQLGVRCDDSSRVGRVLNRIPVFFDMLHAGLRVSGSAFLQVDDEPPPL